MQDGGATAQILQDIQQAKGCTSSYMPCSATSPTYTFSSSSIAFLDLTIMINDEGDLTTNLYRKPSSGNTILHASSAHPAPLICSIPYKQYLCLRRNCSTNDNFINQADLSQNRLLARGDPRSLLRKTFNKPVVGLDQIFYTKLRLRLPLTRSNLLHDFPLMNCVCELRCLAIDTF